MTIQIFRQNDKPLYLQVADQLRAQIESGELTPETRLPASRAMAKQLGVNRVTIINAYTELEAEGLVVSRVGSGTYVAPRETMDADIAHAPPISERTELGSSSRPWNASQMLAEMMRLSRQPGNISFAGGAPASEFLPVNEFRRALNAVLRRDGAAALQYEEAVGYTPLRDAIAARLHEEDISVSGDNILITAGCQQALDMALRVLTRRSDGVIVVEDPCYLGLLDLTTSRRVTPIGIPLDAHGLRLDVLETAITRYRPDLIYATASFQNPTGVTMPLERRLALLDLAVRHGVPILEDATYDALRYEGADIPSLKSLDHTGIVLHAGGFSKTLVPGIRIGYLVAPPSLHQRIIAAKQTADILTSPLNQRALYTYLQSGHFAEHLHLTRQAYRERRDAMLDALATHFPAEASWHCPDGGMYIWVEMPPNGPTATNFYLTAVNYNVAFAIGTFFSASGSFPHALRLNFVMHAPDRIAEGVRRLGKAWQELATRHAPSHAMDSRAGIPIL